jgi:hypothetical protein
MDWDIKESGTSTMKSKLVSDARGAEVHIVILESGEEAFAALTEFATKPKSPRPR